MHLTDLSHNRVRLVPEYRNGDQRIPDLSRVRLVPEYRNGDQRIPDLSRVRRFPAYRNGDQRIPDWVRRFPDDRNMVRQTDDEKNCCWETFARR